jgi:hypothetical protein
VRPNPVEPELSTPLLQEPHGRRNSYHQKLRSKATRSVATQTNTVDLPTKHNESDAEKKRALNPSCEQQPTLTAPVENNPGGFDDPEKGF